MPKLIAYKTKELTNHTPEEILELVEGIKGKKATNGESSSSSSTRVEEKNGEIEEIKEESVLNAEDLKMEESIGNEKQEGDLKGLEENKKLKGKGKNIVEDTINEKGIEQENEEENLSFGKQEQITTQSKKKDVVVINPKKNDSRKQYQSRTVTKISEIKQTRDVEKKAKKEDTNLIKNINEDISSPKVSSSEISSPKSSHDEVSEISVFDENMDKIKELCNFSDQNQEDAESMTLTDEHCLEELQRENFKEDVNTKEMDKIRKISVQLHFHAFALIIARKIEIISEEYITIPKENFTPKYLKEIYKEDKEKKEKKQKLIKWLKEEVEDWLRNLCKEKGIEYGGFSMILGGSELLETAEANSDLDIIFLVHQIYEKEKESFKECKMCSIKRDSLRPCIEEHDLIFGNSKLSLYTHLKRAIENEASINFIENSRVPLLAIEIQGVEMDVMIANIPDSKIDDNLDLTKHDNIENIKGNLDFIGEKINLMIKLKDPLDWPIPIILEQLTMPTDLPQLSNNDFIKSWNLLSLRNDYMPIISPIFPEQNTAFNTNEFTRDIIVKEMKKAYAQLDRSTSLLTEKFYKDILFKKLDYTKQYEHFLLLVCSEKIKIEETNENKSCEFVKTKVRGLLVRWAKKATLRFKIEENTTENVEENYKIYKLSDYLEEYHALTNLEWKCSDGELDFLSKDGTISCPKIEDIESKEKTNEKWKKIYVDGKVRKFTYYFVNYKGALNVAKYKIDHIRQKLEVREKDDIHRAFYRCSNEGCKRQYDVMDMGKIFDPFTQEMRCWQCHSLVEQDELASGPSSTTRSSMAKFNEQMTGIFSLLKQMDGIRFGREITEPTIQAPIFKSEGETIELETRKVASGLGQRAFFGAGKTRSDLYGGDITVSIGDDNIEKTLEAKAEIPWLLSAKQVDRNLGFLGFP
uniref:Transcription initiation factor IIE subunit alpha N-terminal domain-containing protein n=1 Tax=Meloidogyne javanica TaxID=6303 RepID=A0A915LZ42_MELJA